MGKQTDVGSRVIVELWYRMILFQKIIPEKKTMQTTDYVYIYMCVCMCVDVHVCAFTCVYVLACVCMCPSNTYVMTLKKKLFPTQ